MISRARSPDPPRIRPARFSSARRVAVWFHGVLIGGGLLLAMAPGASWGREVRVTLLHTADVRGHVLALPLREQKELLGGLLKDASLISEARQEEHPVLLVDLGQLVTGSAEAELSDRSLPSRAAGWLRYDARLPDSADWTSVPERVLGLGPLVVSNVREAPPRLEAEGALTPYRVLEVDGIRIGLLGLVEDSASLPPGVTLAVGSDADAMLYERLQQLRAASPQMVVLLLRAAGKEGQCMERARGLARRFPELDVILGGGDGEVVRSASWDGVVFSQAGRQGRWVGRVDFTYDTVRRERTHLQAGLLEAGADVEEHGELRRWLGRELASVAWELDRILCSNLRALDGTSDWPGQSGVQRLVSEAIAAGTDAEIVLLEKQAAAGLAAGPVRVRDVFRMLPEARGLVTLEVTAAELREVLEENAALLAEENFLGIHGVTYVFDPSAPVGERIQNLRLADGERPHGRKRFRLAVHDHLLGTESGRDRLRAVAAHPECRIRREARSARRLLLDYLGKADSLDLRPLPGLRTPSPASKTTR